MKFKDWYRYEIVDYTEDKMNIKDKLLYVSRLFGIYSEISFFEIIPGIFTILQGNDKFVFKDKYKLDKEVSIDLEKFSIYDDYLAKSILTEEDKLAYLDTGLYKNNDVVNDYNFGFRDWIKISYSD